MQAFITAVGNAGVADAVRALSFVRHRLHVLASLHKLKLTNVQDDLLQSYLDLFTDVDRDLSGEIDIKEVRIVASRLPLSQTPSHQQLSAR